MFGRQRSPTAAASTEAENRPREFNERSQTIERPAALGERTAARAGCSLACLGIRIVWMAATKHTAATRPWMGGRDGRAVHRARVRRHSRPPAQRAHTHRITRATAARARTSVKHWPLHAARMRASAGSRTASARSARRPPRAPDMRGDMGLGDPQPSIGHARRLRAAVVRQNSGSSAGHARRRNKTHRAPSVWVRTTPRCRATNDARLGRCRLVFRSAATNAEPKPNRIGGTDSVSFCVRSPPTRNETLRRRHKTSRSTRLRGAGRGTLRFRTSSKRWPRGRCLSCTSTTTSSRHTTCWRGYACGRPSLGWRDAAMGVSDAPQVRLVV